MKKLLRDSHPTRAFCRCDSLPGAGGSGRYTSNCGTRIEEDTIDVDKIATVHGVLMHQQAAHSSRLE
jgi:hypothetical protein